MNLKHKYRPRNCKCCHEEFRPQRHNAYHQRFCTQASCQRVSHRESQRRYNATHPDRYGGSAEMLRVQLWRSEHPRYGG